MTGDQIKNPPLCSSCAPHLRAPVSTRSVMIDVLIALSPLLLWGCYIFGMRALTVTIISVASCVIFELLFNLITKKEITVGDFSAVVTGVLLAYNLPHTIPFWMPVVGAFFSIVIAKMLFGGLGKNIVNPALAGKTCLLVAFTSAMSVPPVLTKLGLFEAYQPTEVLSGTASLSSILDPASESTSITGAQILDMLLGNESGTIGEVSALLILLGFLYLLFRQVISWHIPLTFIGTVALITYLLPTAGFERFDYSYTLTHLLSGGLMLAAVFMATDYVTCPITKTGRIIFGIGCGVLTVLIRYFAKQDGTSYAVLAMNLLVIFIDKITAPRPFGCFRAKMREKAGESEEC